jgi:Flp pilus assembly protein TadG
MLVLRFLRSKKGTAAVEFALLSPLYLMLLMGLVAYGIYFGASHSVQQIAADAARIAVGGVDHAERQRLVNGFIAGHSDGYAFVDPSKLRVEFNADSATTQYFTVKVTYDARNLPIWQLAANLPLPATSIIRQSVVRIGGV